MIQNILLAGALFAIYKLYQWTKCPKELEHLPVMSSINFYLNYELGTKGFEEKMKDMQPLFNEHGIFRVFGIDGWMLWVGDAKISKEIFTKSDIFLKPVDFTKKLSVTNSKFIGRSQVVSNNGSEWKRHRKVINPIFNQTWNTDLFGSCAQDVINEWVKEDGKEVLVGDLIQRMTLDVFGKAIFDFNFDAVKDKNSEIYNLYTEILDKTFGEPIYFLLPFLDSTKLFGRPELDKKLDKYQEFIHSIMNKKKEQLGKYHERSNNDLVSAFLISNEKTDDQKLTMEEIRDNLAVFIVAGHDTTSNTLTTTLYYLARYPEIQDKLRAQVLEALGNPSSVQIPTIEQLKNIPLLDMVNKESMRCMTTAAAVTRSTAENYTLSNGLTVPKDTFINVSLWGLHHNDKFFKNPDEFDPQRFENLATDDSRSWQPFISGARTCVGNTFSLVEQRVTIAMLLQKFEFFMDSNNPDFHTLRLTKGGIIRPIDLHLSIKVRS